MKKLNSFAEFSASKIEKAAFDLAEKQEAKRSNEAATFKTLLSEYGVGAIKELSEEQRSEFFNKLRGIGINESVSLIEEGTRGQFGKIDKRGNITSVYTHYDSYPENMLPIIKSTFKSGKNVDFVLKKGDNSGLEKDVKNINFYGDFKPSKGTITNISNYLRDVADGGGAEFVYLWDEANKEWLMADIYGKGYDELYPAFESVVNESEAENILQDLLDERGGDMGELHGMEMEDALDTVESYGHKGSKAKKIAQELVSMCNESVINEASLSGIEFGNDDGIHPTKFKPLTVSLKKNKVKMEVEKEEGYHGYPEVKLTGKRKDIEKVLADIWGPDSVSDYEDYFESVVNEAINVEGKRDAKKVVTQYKKIFYKTLADFGAMSPESIRGCIKYLFEEAMSDANFHREKIVSRNIKGKMAALEIKLPGLGGHFVKLGTTTLKGILDKYYSDIANAAGWSGQGIVEGTALFLQELKEEAMGQSLLDDFNSLFESVNEAEIKSDEDFKEYAYEILQKAFGDEFDEAKADEVVNGILGKSDGDYGKAAGILQSSLA